MIALKEKANLVLKKALVVFFCFCTFAVCAQENATSVLNHADKIRSSDPERLRSILKTITPNTLSKSDRELFEYLSAYSLSMSGKLTDAILLFEKLEKNADLNIRHRSIASLITMYAGVGKWTEGLEKLVNIKANFEKVQSQETRENLLSTFIVFYNHLGEYKLAQSFANDLLAITQNQRNKCFAMAESLYSKLQSGQSLTQSNFDSAIEDCRDANEKILETGIISFLAEYFIKNRQYSEAIELLENNIADVEATKYAPMLAAYYELLAQSYLEYGDYENAEYNANIILETKDQHQYQQSITTAFKVLAATSEKQGSYEKAYYFYKEYTEALNVQLDDKLAKNLAIQKAEFDAAEKNAQIALLDKENMLLKTQALLDSESAQNKRLALALLTMVLVMFVLWTYKNRRNYLRMQHYAQTDELTGVANRHYFTQQANTVIKYCKRTDQPVSFIIFDLDYFKRINDSFGHQVGDTALKTAVNAAKLACRKNDIVGRLGGEEFGILLPGCASHLASFIAEKCRKAIEQADYSSSGHELEVTASFGIADSSNSEYNFEKLFAGADFALYQSKDMGRNRVVQYQKEPASFHI